MNAGDVPPVSRPGSSPDPQPASVSSRQGFRRRRGPAPRGKAPQDAPPEGDAADAPGGEEIAGPVSSADGEDGHTVDVRA